MQIEKSIQQPFILSVPQTRECEQYTMRNEPISSQDLMERAGKCCSEIIDRIIFNHDIEDVRVFCGTGNNGGDGLVIARLLSEPSFHHSPAVHVILCERDSGAAHRSPEMETNLKRWEAIVSENANARLSVFNEEVVADMTSKTLVVDAIFGIGLNKPATGIYADAINAINRSDAMVIAIDTPSGLFADMPTPADACVVMADQTLSIQYPKLAYFLPDALPFYGDVQIVNIGMNAPPELVWDREYLTLKSVSGLLRPLPPFAHKGTFGHGLLVAGSANMPGAAILAATACLRGGAGKVTVHTPALAAQHIPARLPEAILDIDTNEHHCSSLDWSRLQKSINAIAIGPGIGTAPQTVTLLKNILDEVHTPTILDADALNILSENKTWLAFLPPYSILTPHFGEFERLAGNCDNGFERLQKAQSFAERYQVILVLKGQHTVISLPDGKQFVNTTGNAGMATAGSGDVLTGLLLSLMAQGYNPVESALLGVFIHGLAGDLYTNTHDPRSLVASDLPLHFSDAFQQLNLSDETDSEYSF